MLCVITIIRLLLSVDGLNDKGRKFKQVHKVDRPHEGSSLQSTMWTDPMTRVIKQVHKVDGPNKGSRLQSTTWTDPTRVKNLNKSTKWTDPTKGQDLNPQSGRTQQIINNQVHKVDRPHKGSRLQSTTWTDPTRVKNLNKSTK